MTMTTPLRLMTLHLSQIGFTDGLTFISFASWTIVSDLLEPVGNAPTC